MGSGNNGDFLSVLAKNFDVLAVYASVKAIESGSRAEDQQWLTYWVLYSLIQLFELTFAKLLEWFPIWAYAKLFATCWLVLPQFNGAAYVYQSFIRPFYWNPPRVQAPTAASTIWYIPRKKNIFSRHDGVLAAAEAYIEENGPEAFERLMSKANREARLVRRRHSMKGMAFDDEDYRY